MQDFCNKCLLLEFKKVFSSTTNIKSRINLVELYRFFKLCLYTVVTLILVRAVYRILYTFVFVNKQPQIFWLHLENCAVTYYTCFYLNYVVVNYFGNHV